MSIPSQTEFYFAVLQFMGDGTPRRRREIKDEIPNLLNLSPAELKETVPSGMPVYESRAGWAVSMLSSLGLLINEPRKGYAISEQGMQLLARGCSADDIRKMVNAFNVRRRHEKVLKGKQALSDNETNEEKETVDKASTATKAAETVTECNDHFRDETSPEEALELAYEQIEETLQDTLLKRLLNMSPHSFEAVVLELLSAMGYGDPKRTPYSNDGGIDGIVSTDGLGFNPIFTQAKLYDPLNRVGRPEVQAFAGALGRVNRGAFITTSSFSKGAIEFAASYPHATIVLIDGAKLTRLMIRYDVGVSTEKVLRIKRIDSDYFEDK